MNAIRTLSWTEIEQAPEAAGVYAWYSKLQISKADVADFVTKVTNAKARDEQEARLLVEAALDRFIFNPYRESPYQVILSGQLKPRFNGEIKHEPSRSDSLVARLVKSPERFIAVAQVLSVVAPAFTAPLYIGMAANLRIRLRNHKRKIIEYRNQHRSPDLDESVEAGFARQVAARGFDPTNLFVHVTEVNVDTGEQNDIENILNRINYPIFGRN